MQVSLLVVRFAVHIIAAFVPVRATFIAVGATFGAVQRRIPSSLVLALVVLMPLVSGCHRLRGGRAPAPVKPAVSPLTVTPSVLRRFHPNEAGAVMILMYHRFRADEPDSQLNRKPETFARDLEELWHRGFRPVTVSEFVQNKMDLKPGKTPVVLTFDDSLPTQFNLVTGSDNQTHIDPNCAVGIMETFHRTHPDWATKATFFVLPQVGQNSPPFGQPGHEAEKFQYLAEQGYEVGCHTAHHVSLRGLSPQKITVELATAVRAVRAINEKAAMQVLALPYGKVPTQAAAQQAMMQGTDGGTSYKNLAVLKAAWRPVLSAWRKPTAAVARLGTLVAFKPLGLERITEDPRLAKTPGTLEYYLQYFKDNPQERYVSDGNPAVAAIPVALKSEVNPAAVPGIKALFYRQDGSLEGSKPAGGKAAKSALSVQSAVTPGGHAIPQQ